MLKQAADLALIYHLIDLQVRVFFSESDKSDLVLKWGLLHFFFTTLEKIFLWLILNRDN